MTFGMMSREVLHPEVRQVPMICVIDDDDSLLRALRRLLDATGFRVETFSSAEQFLESDHRGRADCLILDVHLGGLSGLDLASIARERHPEVEVILISGTAPRPREHIAPNRERFLEKPFAPSTLADTIRAAAASAKPKGGADGQDARNPSAWRAR